MKRILAFASFMLLFACAVMAQPHDPTLSVTYPFSVDDNGFVELRALAGFTEDGNFMCYGTTVDATVNGVVHALEGQVGCYFTKFLQLADGDYTIVFDATYPETLESKSATYTLSVSGWTKPYIKTYSPTENSTFRADDWMFIEAAGFIKNSMVSGTMRGELINSENATVSPVIYFNSPNKVFKGWMKLNVTDGDYSLRLTFSSGSFTVTKTVQIAINSSASSSEAVCGSISLIYPRENATFEKNESVSFEVEFRDFNELLVKNAVVNMSIYKNDELVDSVLFNESAYSYTSHYVFSDAGKYELKFTGVSDKFNAESMYALTIGNATEIAQSESFVAEILVPQSDVYATNSEITARARLRLNGEPVTASVKFYVDGSEVTPYYDSFGDYAYVIPSLLQGTHSLKVIAESDGMAAVDYVEFMVSDHFLNVSWLKPDESGSVVISKGDLVELKTSVLDEAGDVVSGAFVTADVLEPNGRELQVRLVQDVDSGVYKGDYYPSLDGTYSLSVHASKPGYVSGARDVVFGVTLEKYQLIPELDVNTVLMIILAMAVVIFALAFLKVIF